MTSPRSHRSRASRTCRVAKTAAAAEAIGKIERGSDVFVLTYGQFSLIDALMAILDQVGPADVSISTWTAADAHLERTAALLASANIRSFRMIVDRSFPTRQPGYCHHMLELFGEDAIRLIRTHAKFMLIRSDTHDVVCRTSMNLNENPRLENIEVSEDRGLAEFFQGVVDGVWSEVAAGEVRSALPALDGMAEASMFKRVRAGTIRREALNEPETTHVVG